MPVIQVQMLKGREPQQAADLIQALSEATVKVLGVPEAVVLVTLTEVAPEHWGVGGRSIAEIRAQGGDGSRS